MITCYLNYKINPYKLKEFEIYAKKWIPLVHKFGGIHHGYFLPHEKNNDMAIALFSFPSLTAYETYRKDCFKDNECLEAFKYASKTKCIINYDRSFLRPLFK